MHRKKEKRRRRAFLVAQIIKKAEYNEWMPLNCPLDFKEIQPVHPKGDHSWVFTERTDVEAETPILWPPDVKC